jgi:drug/metabolite transporter (DMT)-like permease
MRAQLISLRQRVNMGGHTYNIMTSRSGNIGLLLALCGFALLSIGDAVVKSVAGAWPAPAIAGLRYVIGASGLAVLLFCQQGRTGFRVPNPGIQLLRGFSVAIATICFFSSITLMPLAEATAITFTSPMITALLAALILKEPVGKATIMASVIAFAGVLLILRPNFVDLGWAALLPLGSAIGMALLMIGNRAVAGMGSPLQMQFLIAAAAVPMLVGAAIAGHFSGMASLRIALPDWTIIAKCAVVSLSASTAHWLIFLGTTKASAADIAPMTYVQLLVAMVLGIAIFGDWPDLTSLVGSAIIIGAGLFLWHQKPA